MPSTSIYLPQDVLDAIDERLDPDQSRSDWIKTAVRRQLDHEHDDLDELERRVEAMEEALIQAAIHNGEPAEYLDEATRVFGSQRDYVRTDHLEQEEDSSESAR